MINRRMIVRSLAIGVSAFMLVGTGVLAGCTPVEGPRPAIEQGDQQSKLMTEYKELTKSNPKADALFAFLDQNSTSLSKENTTRILFELEKVQQKALGELENRYYNGSEIQEEMQKLYVQSFDLETLESTQNQELKKLLEETKALGYKVETTEGSFFPVIDYERYKMYSTYGTAEAKDYFDIMAVESNQPAAKDAGLLIGWDEILNRALAQEQFVKTHEASVKAEEIEQLRSRYISFMLTGLDNTPLFSYDTKIMAEEAKTAYANALLGSRDSEVLKLIGDYMEVLRESDYKYTEKIEQFIGENKAQ